VRADAYPDRGVVHANSTIVADTVPDVGASVGYADHHASIGHADYRASVGYANRINANPDCDAFRL